MHDAIREYGREQRIVALAIRKFYDDPKRRGSLTSSNATIEECIRETEEDEGIFSYLTASTILGFFDNGWNNQRIDAEQAKRQQQAVAK